MLFMTVSSPGLFYYLCDMKNFFILLAILAVTTSCDVQKRAARHIRKAVMLDPTIMKKDTIVVTDSIFIAPEWLDTTIDLSLHEPQTITSGPCTLKVRDNRPEGLDVTLSYGGDTIYMYKEVPVEKIVYKPEIKTVKNRINPWLFLIGFVSALALFIFGKFQRIF